MKSQNKTSNKRTIITFVQVILGAMILSFGMYNIHAQTNITEGGVLGLILLFEHWFGLSPAFISPILDGICYLLGFKMLGKAFIKVSVLATATFAGSYWVFEQFSPIIPDLSANPLLAAVLGAVFVGVGVGLVVRAGGACGGDDALALVISKVTKMKISTAYLFTDIVVLIASLSYIPFSKIAYSLITVTISSNLIGLIHNFEEHWAKAKSFISADGVKQE